MGNASAKDVDNGHEAPPALRSSDGGGGQPGPNPNGNSRRSWADHMRTSPPESPHRSRSPLMFSPQIPVAPMQRSADVPLLLNHTHITDSHGPFDAPLEKGIPTLITWSQGGREVLIEGSWDNWTSRKALQVSGKDHSILLVLPSGVYHYKFLVDGQWRCVPDLPHVTDRTGQTVNLLDVTDYLPENPESITEFVAPPSPDSSYGWSVPVVEDFAKEPPALPPQLHLTVLGSEDSKESSAKPQHVVIDHVFIEKGWGAQSMVALGLTHRFHSKYVTVVLYKPMRRQ